MADVQYVTLYLPDGTTVSVIAGSQLYASYLATGATTTPVTRTASTVPQPALPDVRTPVATVWFMTPNGPQPITDPDTQTEYRRRDYATITAAQANLYFQGAAQIPDVSFVTGQELPAAVATAVTSDPTVTAALRAAFVPGRVLNNNGSVNGQKKLTVKLTADGLDIDDLIIEDVA